MNNNHLEDSFFRFFNIYYTQQVPILLALSGGPDSLALFQLLLLLQKKQPLSFGIAHIDHGWRAESAEEATYLQKMANESGISFHLIRLNPAELKGNLEQACRLERLKFYSELCKKHHYQAVLLGHHADDLAETTLKRIFEGGSLTGLANLKPVSSYEELTLWRPLLQVRKAQIIEWLELQNLVAFTDSTNLDDRFLRGRCRTTILPQLSSNFGKEVAPALCSIAKESAELDEFLNHLLNEYLIQAVEGAMGALFDFNQIPYRHPYAFQYLIKRLCKQQQFLLSREMLQTASELLLEGSSNKKLESVSGVLYLDRGRLFLVKNEINRLSMENTLSLNPGEYRWGPWDVSVEHATVDHSQADLSGWQEAWKGALQVVLPKGEYRMGIALNSSAYPGKSSSIGKVWNNHKVPAFLRSLTPVIWDQDLIVHQFLVKSTSPKSIDDSLKVSLQLIK